MGVLFAIVLVPGAAKAVSGPTLYVDRNNASCSDDGSGTIDHPFCTIGAAARALSAGQTVQVASGTYSENVTVSSSGTSSAPIVFTAAPGATVTLSGQTHGFTISGRNWITVSGFTVTNTSSQGIYVSSSSNITLAGNDISYAGRPVSGSTAPGIRLSGTTNSLIVGNIADHNTYAGIEVNSDSTGNEVRDNTTFANASVYTRRAPGIRFYQAPGNIADGNITHDNEDSGFECYQGANNSLIYNNVSYNNGDHGIDDYVCTGNRIVGNTVFHNVTAGINVEGGSTGATLANNISVDNGIRSPRTHSDIRIEQGSTSGTTLDYDLVNLTTSDTLFIWNSVSYSTLAAFQAASGQEHHAIVADPRWVSPSAGDFHLTAGSPAIDSADSGVSGWPSTDITGSARSDEPTTTNTGTGPRTYDDRGAYEFQPGGDQPPSASLTVTPSSGAAPLAATADASASTDPDSPIAGYTYDFGDGSPVVGPQMGANASHTYQAAGTYTVTVTVTDTAGLSSTATATVQVSSAEDLPPSASLTVTPSSGTPPLAVTADASASSDTDATPIASYTFDFGDGSPAVGPQTAAAATHTYQVAGSYRVTVTATDTAGLSSTATATVQATSSTNLVGNPDFETDLTGWNTSGSDPNVVLTRVAGGHGGSWCVQVSNTGSTTATSLLNDSPNWARTTNAGTYTGSIWARADAAGAVLKLRFREYNGSTLVGSATTQATLGTSWQQVTVTYTIGVPGSTLDFNAYVTKAAPGVAFYADDASITN